MKKALLIAFVALTANQVSAWSASAKFICTTESGLSVTYVTPVAPYGMVGEDIVNQIKESCEALKGQLVREKTQGPRHPLMR